MNVEDSTNPAFSLSMSDSLEKDMQDSLDTARTRPLYSLFVLPVVMLFFATLIGYVRHYLFLRVRNIMNMDNYMVSTEVDPDQTSVKVLEILDALSTFDYNTDNELLWDNSFEGNAKK